MDEGVNFFCFSGVLLYSIGTWVLWRCVKLLVWVLLGLGDVNNRSILLDLSKTSHLPLSFIGVWVLTRNLRLPDVFGSESDERQNSWEIEAAKFRLATPDELESLGDVCAICFGEMESSTVTTCSHFFHRECLGRRLAIRNACPVCERDFGTRHRLRSVSELKSISASDSGDNGPREM